MADDIKRLNYFTGQFLDAKDFTDEQTYLKEMRWRDNQLLFSPGIRVGLEVAVTPDAKGVTLTPGIAFDVQGREIVVLPAPAQPPVYAVPTGLTGSVSVVVSYEEFLTDEHSVLVPGDQPRRYTGATRVTESPKVEIHAGDATQAQIPLAVLVLDQHGLILSVNTAIRQLSQLRVAILRQNELYLSGNVGGSSLSYNAHRNAGNNDWVFPDPTRTAVTLEIDDAGGVTAGGDRKARFDVFTTTNGSDANRKTWQHRLRVDGETGNVGVGTPAAEARLSVVNAGAREIGGSAKSATFATSAGELETTAGKELALASFGFTTGDVPDVGLLGNSSSLGFRARRLVDGFGWETAAIGIGMDVDDTVRAGGLGIWLHPTGRVGIGTFAPDRQLTVQDPTGAYINAKTETGVELLVGADFNGGIVSTMSNHDLQLRAGGNVTRMVVAKDGHVDVVGVLNAGSALNVAGVLNAGSGLNVTGALEAGSGLNVTGVVNAWSGLNVAGVLWASSGLNVVGGLNANAATFTGDVTVQGLASAAGLNVGNNITINATDFVFGGQPGRRNAPGRALVDDFKVTVNGVLKTRLTINYDSDWDQVWINGDVHSPSSRNLKDNIRSLTSHVAKRIVSTLEPVSFSFKQNASKSESLGFIAEDSPPEVAPGDRQSIIYNHIVAALTRFVKDQQELIDALEARLSRLERTNAPA